MPEITGPRLYDSDRDYRAGYELAEKELADEPRVVREDALRRIDDLMAQETFGSRKYRALLGAATYLNRRHERR